jgi:hypothetical protein
MHAYHLTQNIAKCFYRKFIGKILDGVQESLDESKSIKKLSLSYDTEDNFDPAIRKFNFTIRKGNFNPVIRNSKF